MFINNPNYDFFDCICILVLTTFVEPTICFKSCIACVLNSIVNVDCVVKFVFSFISLFFVIFLNNIIGNSSLCRTWRTWKLKWILLCLFFYSSYHILVEYSTTTVTLTSSGGILG
jgi:hypothetical protein